MLKRAPELYQRIILQNAHIYICGNIRMAADVIETLAKIIQTEGKMSIEQARGVVDGLKVNFK